MPCIAISSTLDKMKAVLPATGRKESKMTELRNELDSLGVNASKLDEIMKTVEAKEMYKVYILYEFLDWDNETVEDRFVLYTEDEHLAKAYYNLLQEVEEAFESSYGTLSSYYTAKLEKIQVQNYALARCPFCGEPVDRSKGYYCPNCGST